jgi:trans-aconitate 2-methyltransferase
MWNADQYLRFSNERDRPFFDLVAQIDHPCPRLVADLGCGTGHLTATLLERWPEASVYGVDSSAQMLERAKRFARPDHLELIHADLRTWQPTALLDVIVSNAALQWLNDHESLIPQIASLIAPDGFLAVQMPANFDSPSHVLLQQTMRDWKQHFPTDLLEVRRTEPLEWYIATLTQLGFRVNAWETTYQHLLHGENPVLEWVKGTALRPALNALELHYHNPFLADYGARLLEAYPQRLYGTLLSFRRVFFVARKR